MGERKYDLVAFDVDGTLVEHGEDKTVWEVMNSRFIGDDKINKERYARYKDGKLTYSEWVRMDVSGWRDAGATRRQMVEALHPLTLMPGTREVLDSLQEHGIRLAIISGTINLLLDALLPDSPFHEVYVNRIHFNREGRITGWDATPFDMDGKAVILKRIASREGIPLSRCAFVGDGTNDLWIARTAGLSVAFNPKCASLEDEADVVVRSRDLRDILPYIL